MVLEYEMMSSKANKIALLLLEMEYLEVPARHKILSEISNSTVFFIKN